MKASRGTFFLVASLTVLASFSQAFAGDLGNNYTCQSATSPERNVKDLLARGVIEKTPYNEDDGVKTFAAKPGHTVFGFPLIAVAAWEEGSRFFARVPGTSPPIFFSLIVRASSSQVTQAAKKSGIKIVTGPSNAPYPVIRVAGFNSDHPDPLPKGADGHSDYAQLLCYLR